MSKKSSRRQFLAGTLGAATLAGCARTRQAAIAPEVVDPPAPKRVPARRALGPGDRIRVGFVGVGGRGSSILRSLLTFGDVEVVAIADTYDVWRDRALGWCRETQPATRGYLRFEDLLDNEEVDALFVATPDHIHAPAVMRGLDAGCDIYCEKPMTLHWEEALALEDRVAKTGAVLQVGTQLRSISMYQRAREAVRAGAIGQLVEVQVNRHQGGGLVNTWPTPNEATADNVHWDLFLRHTADRPLNLRRYFAWRLFKDYSNGVIGDLMVHHLDIAHYITGAGMPTRVMAVGGIYHYDDGRTCPDTVSVLVEYPERFHMNYTTTIANGKYGLHERYLGTEGTIDIRGMGRMVITSGDIEEEVVSPGLPHEPHLRDFLDCMRTRETPAAPVSAGRQAAVVADMAVISEETGRAMTWDAATRQVVPAGARAEA